jgi:uncharacterized protein YkwD
VNRCLLTPIVFISTLLLTVSSAIGATNTASNRAGVHVRHQTIHRAPRKGSKRSCRRTKNHKHSKRAGSCKRQKQPGRHTDRRSRSHGRSKSHKRAVGHSHERAAVRGSRPASASRDCPGASLTPKAGDIESVVSATLCLVNDERARFGESALIEDPRLTSAADGHSRDMDARDYFEHVSPGGQTLLMRVQASGFIPNGNVGYTLGENIAWGTLWLGTPNAIVKAWMASPGHRANILNREYRYTGIGIDAALPHSMSNGQAGGMYTQDFGTIVK